ncbi:dihydrofolate reductase family protein [Methanosarcina sp.]|jgi:dihydrofolate reductase|uniref:dihydrofolate reductase family protein n=1 Tax=Methanosarcina sp. TaxID=2213 RepID=UPI002B5D181A|nr:dihydrofolate reductase family protein [Methanosarcina sp.]HOW14184.1 dihydrofolate reductase family protein [Methanosarcina sp.]
MNSFQGGENTLRIKLYIACSLDGYIAREKAFYQILLLSNPPCLDGYIAREKGSIDWLTEYENNSETDYGYSEFYASIGTVLMGRKTYEQVLGFGDWPYAEKKTCVFTRQKEPLRREKNVEFVSRDIGEFVRLLKENTDEDIWLVGGSQLIKVFLEEALVEDMIVFIVPIILGSGIPLFDRIGKQINLVLRFRNMFIKLEF